ncbi:hypothetical protein MTO96_041879, partial [Rhipicephalus appendiculatus]
GTKDTRQMLQLQQCKVEIPRPLPRVQAALYQALVQPKKMLKLKYKTFRASTQVTFSPSLKKVMILGFILKVFRLLQQNVKVLSLKNTLQGVLQ